jgi:hypothetical protein
VRGDGDTNSVAEEEVAPEDLVEEVSIPGVPEGGRLGGPQRLDFRHGEGGHRSCRQGHQ